jgi:translocator protein
MNNTAIWYAQLIKPFWAPPAWLFGPVWMVLYTIIAVSFGTIFYKTLAGKLSWLIALPFLLNLIFNFAFSPIQFGLQNNMLAAFDIILIFGTLIWALLAIYFGAPQLLWVALINIPYFLWVLFATILQITITVMNWK